MGDLYLTGYKIIGSLKCSQGGHRLTNQLLRKVFQEEKITQFLKLKKTIPHTYLNRSTLKSIA